MDFSDRLSPMLVKELRQGMRGIGFVILFIALQALLVLVMIGYSSADSYGNSGESLSGILIMFFSLAVLLVQPLRGITALSSEIKGKTIDLMVLTKLSAWRIIFGKWVSLVSQSALIFATLLPYMIMRYFFGGMQLFSEISLLFCIFIASATLTAASVGLSAVPSIVLRGIVCVIGGVFILQFSFAGVMMSSTGMLDMFTFSDPNHIYALLSYFGVCGFITWLSLDFGASMVAPLAENRSTPRKLIGIPLVLLASVAMIPVDDTTAIVMGMVLIVPLAVTALTESPYLVPRVCLPFVRKFGVGNICGRVLYPGWSTGVLYVVCLFVILQLVNVMTGFEGLDNDEMHATVITIFASLLFPIVIYRLFFSKSANIFGVYLGIMMFTWLIAFILLILSQVTDQDGILWLFCWIPPVNMFCGLANDSEIAIFIAYLSFAAYAMIPLILSKVVWKHIRDSEIAAKVIIDKEKPAE
jgi:ABC-type transport system involved in multi-copper enzyme maturation permease subunit